MLEIGVHYHAERPESLGQASKDGSAEAAWALPRRPHLHPDGEHGVRRDPPGNFRCGVVRIVDHENLGRCAAEGVPQPGQQRANVPGLIPGGNYDAQVMSPAGLDLVGAQASARDRRVIIPAGRS